MADPETREVRLKRLRMRSMRRGIKEMDIILMRFSEETLEDLSPEELDLYDALLSENDQELYAWVTGQTPVPERFVPIMKRITSGLPAI